MTTITLACVVLYNHLRTEKLHENGSQYVPVGYVDGDVEWFGESARETWRKRGMGDNVHDLKRLPYRFRVHAIRNIFVDYFNSPAGTVPRREEVVNRAK